MFNIKRKRKEDDLTYLERVYRKILKKDPNSFLYLPLASIYYHKGNREKAINALQNCLLVHSNYVTAKYYLAFLYRENGEVDKAAEMFKKIAFASQGHYAAHKALVRYYLDKKEERSALTELKKLARLVPSDVLVHDQINRLEEKLIEGVETLTSEKDDEKKAGERRNMSEIMMRQLKEENRERKDTPEVPAKVIFSLENWLKNIDRAYEKT